MTQEAERTFGRVGLKNISLGSFKIKNILVKLGYRVAEEADS